MREKHDSRRQLPVLTASKIGQFSLSSIRGAGRVVLRACGRLVLGHGAHEPVWAPHLDLDTASRAALDLSCVKDVDARGIGVLADLAARAVQRGVTVSVIAASGVVQRLAEMTRVDRALPGNWNQRTGILSCVGALQQVTIDPEALPSGCRADHSRSAAA
jgi:ABC-type transporter Mla MlaB component